MTDDKTNPSDPRATTGDLDALRAEIDGLDERILELLNQRAEVVIAVGQAKIASGAATYVPNREREVLDRLIAKNEGPLADRTIQAIYRELMSGSLSLERQPRIAYLGPAGSFSHLAATRKFGSSVEQVALGTISAIFDEIERGRAELGIVPIENSTGGGVTDTLEACHDRDLCICGEINLGVHLYLFGQCAIEEIQAIYSKPEAFAQCRQWLTQRGLSAKTVPAASTSKAVEIAAADPTAAAIGSRLAGEIHHLQPLAERIEDDPNNITRFWVLSKTPAKPTGDDKSALYFQAADRPGALVEVLDAFRARNINMTFIQSRPGRGKARPGGGKGFDYAFFADIAGHAEDSGVSTALEQARAHCTHLQVLGSFPRAKEVL